MITKQDLSQLKQKGISEEQALNQLKQHKTGFPYADIQRPATPGDGIIVINQEEVSKYNNIYSTAINNGLDICKFVPASGAASRMFKDLYSFLEATDDELMVMVTKPPFDDFFKRLKDFAFYNDVKNLLPDNFVLSSADSYRLIIKLILTEDGLNYGKKPKGVLKFHRYNDFERTPMEEHLLEAAMYGKSSKNMSHIHFTVSKEHEVLFNEVLDSAKDKMEKKYGTTYEVSFSNQKPSTDTIAATPDNEPFRLDNGEILFRPGGHGALIQNLNDLNHDIIFVKNIDNVVPEHLIDDTVLYKKLLTGILIEYREQVFKILNKLDNFSTLESGISDGLEFISNVLKREVTHLNILKDNNRQERANRIREILNRPIRVAGMVKNEGEPGGGPFWVKSATGTISLQVVESSQIDLKNPEKRSIVNQSTHFNPVDLICSIKDYQGNKFNLLDFVDPVTGFISEKSMNGKTLKALELPGLWNGAMAHWLTFFVEVPVTTFNPVKTIFDLLRPQHQPEQ